MSKKDWPLVRRGSSKDIYRVGNWELAFSMTDDYSVFDVGKGPDKIPGKGASICACAVKSFEIAEKIGIPTHFIAQEDERTIVVREVQIISGIDISPREENYLVPLEFIWRREVAGSIEEDFRLGRKDPANYGFPPKTVPAFGTPFPKVVHEITTKFEPIDRKVTMEEACRMAGLTPSDLDEYWEIIDTLSEAIAKAMSPAFHLADGKIEAAIGPGRKKFIADVCGTPDEDRPYYLAHKEEGETHVVHCGKEHLRQIHKTSGYYKKLKEARAKGEADPPIPYLSKEQVLDSSWRYGLVARRYAGVNIY